MPLGTPALEASATGTTAAINSGSITIASGSMVYVAFGQRHTGSTSPAAGTLGDTAGWTWAALRNDLNPTGVTRIRQQIWTSQSNGSANTITCTPDATDSDCAMQVISVSGSSTDTSNSGADTSNTAGDPAPSLTSAPAATSTVLAFASITGTVSVTPPTNYTEISELGSSFRLESAYDAVSAAQSASWSTGGGNSVGALIEVKISSIAYTITADVGSYALTGTAAGLKRGYTLAAAVGSYAVTGTAALFQRGYSIVADVGSYFLTGTDAVLDAVIAYFAAPLERTIYPPGFARTITVPPQGREAAPPIALRTIAVPALRRTLVVDSMASRTISVPPLDRRIAA